MLSIFRSRRTNRSDGGQVLVEVAVLMPILLMLVMGIVEFGWILHGYIVVVSGAREGARVASVRSLRYEETVNDEIEYRIKAAVQSAFPSSNVELVSDEAFDSTTVLPRHALVTILPYDATDRHSDEQVEVKIKAALPLLTPMLKGILPDPFGLNAVATMRVE